MIQHIKNICMFAEVSDQGTSYTELASGYFYVLLAAFIYKDIGRSNPYSCCTRVAVPWSEMEANGLFYFNNSIFHRVMTKEMKNCSGVKHSNANTRATCESGISIFNFENDSEIRVDANNGNPLFCLSDICRVLGIPNPSYVKNRLNENGVFLKYILTSKGRQQATFINEGNLYKVIFRSDKPKARKFENWVTDEVLPSIRKTGSYGIEPSNPFHAKSISIDLSQDATVVKQIQRDCEVAYAITAFDDFVVLKEATARKLMTVLGYLLNETSVNDELKRRQNADESYQYNYSM